MKATLASYSRERRIGARFRAGTVAMSCHRDPRTGELTMIEF
jgi:hypothetical protein